MTEQVYNVYYDTIGNLHWTGIYTGSHVIKAGESND